MTTFATTILIFIFALFACIMVIGGGILVSNLQNIDSYEDWKYNTKRILYMILGIIFIFCGLYGMIYIATHY